MVETTRRKKQDFAATSDSGAPAVGHLGWRCGPARLAESVTATVITGGIHETGPAGPHHGLQRPRGGGVFFLRELHEVTWEEQWGGQGNGAVHAEKEVQTPCSPVPDPKGRGSRSGSRFPARVGGRLPIPRLGGDKDF